MDEVTIQLKYLAMQANPGTIIYWANHYAPFVGCCARRAIDEPDFVSSECTHHEFVVNASHRQDQIDYPIIEQYPQFPDVVSHPHGQGKYYSVRGWTCYGCGMRVDKHG